jgi:hypothetical protein
MGPSTKLLESSPPLDTNTASPVADSGCEPWRLSGWAIRAGVPKLRDDAAAGGMHGDCDQALYLHLFRTP